MIGTSTVAPNITKVCCNPRTTVLVSQLLKNLFIILPPQKKTAITGGFKNNLFIRTVLLHEFLSGVYPGRIFFVTLKLSKTVFTILYIINQ